MTGDEELSRLSVLAEPTRRAIYEQVAASSAERSRDEVAAAAGVSRKLAAFHLEKLLETGLLEAVYRRVSGRSGPGAGRPAKLYRRAPVELAVTVPERRYDLLARILAGAQPDPRALREAAKHAGDAIGRKARGRAGLLKALAAQGYEPFTSEGVIRLRNCPFDAVARDHRAVVCDLNLALLTAAAEAAGAASLRPELDPQPGCCCVAFRAS